MVVIDAFTESIDAVRNNPILVAVPILLVLAMIPFGIVAAIGQIIFFIFSFFWMLLNIAFFTYAIGGLLGMCNEALDGSTSLSTFLDEGKANFVDVFVIALVSWVVLFAISVMAQLFGSIALLGTLDSGSSESFVTFIMSMILAYWFIVGLYMIFGFIFQFVYAATVVDDSSVGSSFSRSYRVVKNNILSTIGYDIVGGIVYFVSMIGTVLVVSLVMSQVDPSPLLALFAFLVTLLIAAVVVPVLSTFHIAFYRRASESIERSETES
ncbi:DUF7847 domain-containing protein [Halocatena halophila]|uniref:DUF7847 domain-containing protein n=1 Tax=Halocatena halophila TaxID=2814576 RepID=UPI002ED519B4